MKKLLGLLLFAALVLVLTIGTTNLAAATSGAVTVGPLTLVSGPSPYASCVNAGEPGTVYINAEVEPYVAVNPATVGTANVNLIGV